MSTMHTKEPWVTFDFGGNVGGEFAGFGICQQGKSLAIIMGDDAGLVSLFGVDDPEVRADARRIVACVNALEGFGIAAIEAGVVKELVGALRQISTLRPAGDISTATDTRATVQKMECIALNALAKIGGAL